MITSYGNARSSPNVLANDFSDTGLHSSQYVPMVFYFDQPMAGVGMWLGTVSSHGQNCNQPLQATISVYDCQGNSIETRSVTVSSAFTTPLEIDAPGQNIQRVVIDYGSSPCPEAIDELAFMEGTGSCSESKAPQVTILSPQKNIITNYPDWIFNGKINEAGLLKSVALNGNPLPVYMSEIGVNTPSTCRSVWSRG